LEALGGAFQGAHIDATAQQILRDFNSLTAAGGDVGGVLSFMGDEVNTLVQQALRYGQALPTAMKPIVQNLFDAGKLTDENGRKLDSLSGITFEHSPLKQSTDAIVAAIDRLGELLGGLPAKVDRAASSVPPNPFAEWRIPDLGSNFTLPDPGHMLAASAGPALLSPAAFTALAASPSRGSDTAVVAVLNELRSDLAHDRMDMPKTLSRAVRDAVQTAGVGR
jgi:hypothetical protein